MRLLVVLAPTPFDRLCGIVAELLHHQQLEVAPMVHQPVQVKEPLVDDILIYRMLVLNDDWIATFVESERVDASAVLWAGAKLGSKKLYPEEGV
nr:hypothetical protein [Salisaeta longa]